MAGGDLEPFIDREQRLEYERSALACSLHELLAVAKAIGLDTSVMRRAVTLRRQEIAQHASHRDAFDTFDEAVGIRMHEAWF